MKNNFIDVIGLDMDGVLVDLQQYQLEKGIAYFCKKFNKDPKDVIADLNAYDVEDIFGCTRQERMKFWKRYIWTYSLLEPAREGASEITHKWHREGREIDIITSRVYVMQDDFMGNLFRAMVRIWLWKEKIYYDKIKYCSEEHSEIDKSLACQEFGTKIMGEDKINNIKEISKNVTIACFNANWNRSLSGENIYRVNDFYQMDELIQTIENSKRMVLK